MRRQRLQGSAPGEGHHVAGPDQPGHGRRPETTRGRPGLGARRFDHHGLGETEPAAQGRLEVGPARIEIRHGDPDDAALAGESQQTRDLRLGNPGEAGHLRLPEAVGVIEPGQQAELVI
jgi:hypothetical protein